MRGVDVIEGRLSRPRPNALARAAAALNGIANARAPLVRWLVMLGLLVVWLWAGYVGWTASVAAEQQAGRTEAGVAAEALYRTLGALTVSGEYVSVTSRELEVARFAGLAVPLIGILFAFYEQLLQSIARMFLRGARGHVVIGGSGPAAVTLARDVVDAGGVVAMIGAGLAPETADMLRRRGVVMLEGEARQVETLRQARITHAAQLVALEAEDEANLSIEAAARNALIKTRRRRPLAALVALTSPTLLGEARRMREGLPPDPAIDPKPFSLDELAARALIQREAPVILTNAQALQHERPHVVIFGYDDAAEACAVRALTGLWSIHFGAPRVTIVTADPQETSLKFTARHPQARAHPGMIADIAFHGFDWRLYPVDVGALRAIHEQRGPASAIIVSTGVDAESIGLALALKRACNHDRFWPAPIYMKEKAATEFSKTFARGDETPDELDAYLQAFGAIEQVATYRLLIDGALDRGAAIAHSFYERGLMERGAPADREMQAAGRAWRGVMETYRAANRASADSALVKLWDAGWRPALPGEGASAAPVIDEHLMPQLAQREHDRWCAERVLSGWRPGAPRDNAQRVHPNLTSWEALSPADQDKDMKQVKAACAIARMVTPQGFMPRV